MAFLRAFLLITLALLLFAPANGTRAAPAFSVEDAGVFVAFPDRISFNARIRSSTPIEQVVLEYGVDKRTCGDITAKAFPSFKPGNMIDVNWTWEMRQTGSEPPGAVIWYRWRVIDRDGNSSVTPDARVTWLDKTYGWQQISRDDLTLHWYTGPRDFADELLNTAVDGIERLARLTGVRPQSPINLYIYGDTQEMQDAILYEPSWTGGVAFPQNNITIIGIHPAYLEWGKRTIVHELTHLIVGQMTFSCGENVPTWLDEGIAVYAEGGLDPWAEARFRQAIAANTLIPVRALSNGFSIHPDEADLSYSQSFSLVSYLVETYGSAKLLALFGNLSDGMTVEGGLTQAYGFNLDELETRWRAWLGAAPPARIAAEAAAQPTPIPTYQPIAAAPTGPPRAPTPTGQATTAPTETAVAVAAVEPTVAVEQATPAPAAVARPNRAPQFLGAALVFLVGLSLTGLASWKLFGGR